MQIVIASCAAWAFCLCSFGCWCKALNTNMPSTKYAKICALLRIMKVNSCRSMPGTMWCSCSTNTPLCPLDTAAGWCDNTKITTIQSIGSSNLIFLRITKYIMRHCSWKIKMLFGNHKNSSSAREKAARTGGNFQNRADLVRFYAQARTCFETKAKWF